MYEFKIDAVSCLGTDSIATSSFGIFTADDFSTFDTPVIREHATTISPPLKVYVHFNLFDASSSTSTEFTFVESISLKNAPNSVMFSLPAYKTGTTYIFFSFISFVSTSAATSSDGGAVCSSKSIFNAWAELICGFL